MKLKIRDMRKIVGKDLAVVALALFGGVSDFNNFDMPYWLYAIVLAYYVGSKLLIKDFTVKSFGNKKNVRPQEKPNLIGTRPNDR